MDANTITLQKLNRAFRDFVFNRVFLFGLITGLILGIVASSIFGQGESPIGSIVISFILGIVASCGGNYFWEKHKKKQQGDKPYWNVSVSPNNISFEGQLQNTEPNKTIIFQTIKKTASSSSSSDR